MTDLYFAISFFNYPSLDLVNIALVYIMYKLGAVCLIIDCKNEMEGQVEENMTRIGFRKEDAADQRKWREGIRSVAEVVRCIRPPSFTGDI